MAGRVPQPESFLRGGAVQPAVWHPDGWILARCRFPGKTLLDSLIHLPLVLPPVVVGYCCC